MKKSLLFISTLFAAGTLGASATTTIDLLDVDNGTVTLAASAGTGQNSKTIGSLALGTVITADTIKSLGANELEWNSSVGNKSLDGQVIIENDLIKLQIGNGATAGSENGNFAGIWFSADDVVTTLSYSVYCDYAWPESGTPSSGIFVYTGTLYGVSSSSGATELASKSLTYGTDFSKNDSSSNIVLSVSNTDTNYDYYVVIFNSYKTTSGTGGAELQISNLVATIIPEPSLFGLFAGTLALGLAGTRRRRGNAKK